MPVKDQGVLSGQYSLIPRTLIFLTNEDHILLLKGSANKRLWANLYNGIGGHVERSEDVLSAARRELTEETGITPKALWLCGVITIDTGQEIGIGIYVFRGECSQRKVYPSEEGIPEWIPVSEINNYPLVEDLPTIIPRVLQVEPGSPPFAAHYQYSPDGKLNISFG
ncbi:MAG: NUDIX domain-containing protein [Bacteroidota bacterium]|nr:NUDIX domain-containing protein [Bacteroidota bacterium]